MGKNIRKNYNRRENNYATAYWMLYNIWLNDTDIFPIALMITQSQWIKAFAAQG